MVVGVEPGRVDSEGNNEHVLSPDVSAGRVHVEVGQFVGSDSVVV